MKTDAKRRYVAADSSGGLPPLDVASDATAVLNVSAKPVSDREDVVRLRFAAVGEVA
jgi:hypothetical protein